MNFQQLYTYMIWQPLDRTVILPPVVPQTQANKTSRVSQSRTRQLQQSPDEDFNPYISTYEAEISSIPTLKRTGELAVYTLETISELNGVMSQRFCLGSIFR